MTFKEHARTDSREQARLTANALLDEGVAAGVASDGEEYIIVVDALHEYA